MNLNLPGQPTPQAGEVEVTEWLPASIVIIKCLLYSCSQPVRMLKTLFYTRLFCLTRYLFATFCNLLVSRFSPYRHIHTFSLKLLKPVYSGMVRDSGSSWSAGVAMTVLRRKANFRTLSGEPTSSKLACGRPPEWQP